MSLEFAPEVRVLIAVLMPLHIKLHQSSILQSSELKLLGLAA
jgi:hypothetical protein